MSHTEVYLPLPPPPAPSFRPRIVNVASSAHLRVGLPDTAALGEGSMSGGSGRGGGMFGGVGALFDYAPLATDDDLGAYAASKFALLLLSHELRRRVGSSTDGSDDGGGGKVWGGLQAGSAIVCSRQIILIHTRL